MINELTYIITNYETIDYTINCYNSIRKNTDKNNNIVIIDDCSRDDSWTRIKLLVNDKNLIIHQNDKNYGIAYSYNKAIDLCQTEKFIMLHSDMYILPNHDKLMLEEFEKYSFLTSFRLEPPIYPPSPDKMQMNFGQSLSDFNELGLLEWYKTYNKDGGMKRMCFPWMTSKTLYNRINGNDELFCKYLVDDDDFYERIALTGANYFQSYKPLVFHFCSRTTKYKDDVIDTKGSDKWNKQYERSTRNFIRKWGRHQSTVYNNDMSMNTNIKKYDIGYVIKNCDPNVLFYVEPFCSNIYTDTPIPEIYIKTAQKNTMYDLSKKVLSINANKINDIIIEFNGTKLTNENFKYITTFQEIIQDSGEVGEFELDIFKVKINKYKPIDMEILISKGFRNTNGYED